MKANAFLLASIITFTYGLSSVDKDYFLSQINSLRNEHGLQNLCYNKKLEESSAEHSQTMAATRDYAHDEPDGSTFTSRISGAGFHYTGIIAENIHHVPTVQEAFDGWLHSPEHLKNMLFPGINFLGLANVQGYWTLDLGTSDTESCDSSQDGNDSSPPSRQPLLYSAPVVQIATRKPQPSPKAPTKVPSPSGPLQQDESQCPQTQVTVTVTMTQNASPSCHQPDGASNIPDSKVSPSALPSSSPTDTLPSVSPSASVNLGKTGGSTDGPVQDPSTAQLTGNASSYSIHALLIAITALVCAL